MESGAFLSRDGMEKLLAGVESGKVKRTIILRPDRLGRDPMDLIKIRRVFRDAGAHLEFVEGPSGDSDEDEFMLFVFGYLGLKERQLFMQRSQGAKKLLASKGRYPTGDGVGLYGYDYDRINKVRVIKESEATVVRMVYQWDLDGMSFQKISEKLNEMGIPTKTGKSRWCHTRAKAILTNPAYTGRHYYGLNQWTKVDPKVHGKRVIVTKNPPEETFLIKDFTPPLISQETFDAVQERIQERSARYAKARTFYLLTGIARCKECVASVCGSMLAKGHRYYRCVHARGTNYPCDAKHIRADELESLVWEMIVDVVRNPEVLAAEVRRLVDTESGKGNLKEAMTKLRKEVDGLRAEQSRLMQQMGKPHIDQDILEATIAPLKVRYDEKRDQLRALEEQQERREGAEASSYQIAEYCRELATRLEDATPETKRAIMGAFQARVEATCDELQVILTVDPSVTTKEAKST